MSGNTLENIFYSVAGLILLILIWRGWKEGVVRMLMSLIAVVAAYAVGFYGSKAIGPLFKSLGYPDKINQVLGGASLGLLIFTIVVVTSQVLFKRTDQQASNKLKIVYGSLGALLGITLGLFSIVLAWEAALLMGYVAEGQVTVIAERKKADLSKKNAHEINPVVQGLADLKKAFKEGSSGKLIEQYDPVPPKVGKTLGKVSQLLSEQDSVERFLNYPTVDKLARHPKIVALRNDGEVTQLINKQDLMGLLRHPKVRDLANDAQFVTQLNQMDFNKALDHAVPSPPKEKAAEPTGEKKL